MTELKQERRLVTEIPGPKSLELFERRNKVVARGISTTLPVFVTDADGAVLRDADGNQLLDFGSGIAVTSVGHADANVVRKASEQLAKFTHTCFMVTPYESYVAVCEALAELTPGDFEKRSALFNSGAEAVENAVKIARAYTKRQAVVVFDHGYHGRTNLTMALTAKVAPYKDGFGPFAPEVYRVPMAYPFRWPTGPENAAAEALEQTKTLIEKQVGAHNVAAVLIEPIQGEGGFIVPPDGFLPGLAAVVPGEGHRLHRRRDPVRLLPHRRLVRGRPRRRRPGPDHHRQGHRRRPAAGRRHRPRGDHGRRGPRRPRRHLRRQPGGLRGRARRHPDHEGAGPGRQGPQDRGPDEGPPAPSWPPPTPASATSAAAAP